MMSRTRWFAGAALIAVAGVALAAFPIARAQDAAKPAAKAEAVVPFFGNEKCPTTGKPVSHTKFVESEGQTVYFCCGKCQAAAKADPKAAVAAAYKEAKAVGNKTCPVSGHAIEAGKGVDVTWQGHTVTLCCAKCEEPFKKSPLISTAKAVYNAEDLANKKCPVMALDGKDEATVDDVIGIYKGKLIRFCCEDCLDTFKKEPDKVLAKASGK